MSKYNEELQVKKNLVIKFYYFRSFINIKMLNMQQDQDYKIEFQDKYYYV